MSKPIVRIAQESDALAIHQLHTISVRELCSKDYSHEIIEGWLTGRSPQGYLPGISAGEMYLAEIDGQIVGFGHAVPGQIEAVFVHPNYSNQGIGSLLVKHGIELAQAKSQGPIQIESTLNARQFYEKLGFVVVREFRVLRKGASIPVLEMILTKET